MSREESITNILDYAQEIVAEAELKELLESKERPRAYIGFEPSGYLHVGSFFITSRMINLLLDAGFEVTILLADWHAYINDKLGGKLERIRDCGKYMQDAFSFGADNRGGLSFVYASELIGDNEYWADLIRNAKSLTLSRLKRAMTIMGRSEDEAEMDSSKLIYPLMQVTDIFRLRVDLAYAGMDQRRAHMLAREVAEARGLKKPIALHTPILSSLKGASRMDSVSKMSKSDPDSAIFIHDSREDVARKIAGAFCPREDVANPVLDICRYIIFPYVGKLEVRRESKYGGDVDYDSYTHLKEDYVSGRLHPKDMKSSTAQALWKVLEPLHAHYSDNPSLLKLVNISEITR